MSLLTLASGNSISRGYDYFAGKKIESFQKLDDDTYHAIVAGSGGKAYETTIDILHPRRSTCTCPHANGRRIICKHMVALYFTVFPNEAKQYIAACAAAEEEEKQRQEQMIRYIRKLNKKELQEILLNLLYSGPEWQYDWFINNYVDE